jgi:hypothetical protein
MFKYLNAFFVTKERRLCLKESLVYCWHKDRKIFVLTLLLRNSALQWNNATSELDFCIVQNIPFSVGWECFSPVLQ